MVRAQGGDPDAALHGAGCEEEQIRAPHALRVSRCDAYDIGRAAFLLGAGRERADAQVHPGVGLRVHAKVGDEVAAGEPLATLVHAGRGLFEARELTLRAYGLRD